MREGIESASISNAIPAHLCIGAIIPSLLTLTAAMAQTPTRPKRSAPWYNISPANLPLPGLVSIFHRVSGLGLFVMLWLLLWLFDRSLVSAEGYAWAKGVLGGGFVKLIMTGLLWAFLHHFCAGIRFLLLDMHVGIELASARRSSTIVFVVSLVLTVILGAILIW